MCQQKKEPLEPAEFVNNFGYIISKKAARYQTRPQNNEMAGLGNAEARQLGEKLRLLRESRGLTRQEFAIQAELDYTELVLVENGLADLEIWQKTARAELFINYML